MPVSFRIAHFALSQFGMRKNIKAILAHYGWDKALQASRSYGTVKSTHLLKTPSTAQFISLVFLNDPVSIILRLQDVTYVQSAANQSGQTNTSCIICKRGHASQPRALMALLLGREGTLGEGYGG